MKPVKSCLWCSSKSLEAVAERKDGVAVLKCHDCGLLMNGKIPINPADYYHEDYYNAVEADDEKGYEGVYYLVSPAFLLWQNSFIEEVNEQHDKKLFLEIGSATGSLLEILRENQPNLKLEGIDISDYAVDVTRQKGFDTHVSQIENHSSTPKKDIVFSSETMEHLVDLRGFLKGVKDNLKDNGTFLFYVPSIVEADARQESASYVRFRTNMEHLLHFTPDFFKHALTDFFNSPVLIQEFRTDFGPCILGAVAQDRLQLSNLKKLFSALDDGKVPKASATFLKNLTIFAFKFGKFQLAEETLKKLTTNTTLKNDQLALVKGLACYHRGELEKADMAFSEYLSAHPTSQVATKLLLANAKELNQIYLQEIANMRQRALLAETKLNELESSKIVSRAIKLRHRTTQAKHLMNKQRKSK